MAVKRKALPLIPDKRYFSISETAGLCAVKPHVLRYWEQEFSQLRPVKRTGGRRYYRCADVALIRRIRELLYDKRFTISGAKQQIKGNGKATSIPIEETNASAPIQSDKQQQYQYEGPAIKKTNVVKQLVRELEELLTLAT